ncbi:MAG: wax ester/triacylglycerol synthase family O-acyltransferase [Acidimicrobiales bacterium]
MTKPAGMRFERRMSDADALMWRNEKDPMLRSTIVAVAILDRAPDPARVAARLERTTRAVPRLRQRVVHSPLSLAPPRWEVDPNFDLQYHLRWFRAPGEAGLDTVLRMAEPMAMQGFDRARPLWEFAVVDGLADGRAASILKLHHSISDGVGAVQIAMNLFDLERDATTDGDPLPEAPAIDVLTVPARIADAIDHERRRLLGIAARLPTTLGRAARAAATDPVGSGRAVAETAASMTRMFGPATRPVSPLMVRRSLSVHFATLSEPLDELKAAARRAGGRLNDAFVAGAVGGLARYHDHHGVDVDELRMTMPINVRGEDKADLAGNAFAPARMLVPLGITDPTERMRAIAALVGRQRAEPAMAVVDPMALVVHRLPTSVSTALFQTMLRGQDFVTSNVPGVPIPVFFAGSAVEAQFPFGPMSGAAMNLTLLSYQDQVHIGVNTDPAAVPDPDVLLGCLQDSFEEIRKLA